MQGKRQMWVGHYKHTKMQVVCLKSNITANLKCFCICFLDTVWNCSTATETDREEWHWAQTRVGCISSTPPPHPLSKWQQSHGASVNCMWWLITWAETFKRSATHLKERGLRRCWSGKISMTLSLEATPYPASHCVAPVKTNMFSVLGQLSQAVSSQVTYPHTHPLMPPFALARSNLHDTIPIVQIKGRD